MMPMLIPPQMQTFALPVVEFNDVPVSLYLQPAEVPLDGGAPMWFIDCSFQICITCISMEGALSPTI